MSAVPMKDSGVEWLGEIPAHWDATALRAVTVVTEIWDPTTQPDAEFRYIDVSSISNEVHRIADYEIVEGRDAPSRARKVVFEGDTIFATVRPYLRNIARVPANLHESICSTGFCVLRPDPEELLSDFLFFSSIADGFVENVVIHQRGSNYPAVSDRIVKGQFLGLPPLTEQRAIAAYLDRETAKIDALIARAERLNALLGEKRRALISHAVTRGLDPSVALKDSGVEWLGEIPRHWKVKRLKFLTRKPLMYGANEAADDDTRDNPRYIRITDIKDDGSLREDTFRSLPHDIAAPYLLAPGDILFARSGSVGKTFRYQEEWGQVCFAGYLIKFSADPGLVTPEFVDYFTSARPYWEWLSNISIQTTIQNVSAEKYANLILPVPPLAEQRAIAAHLDRETARIDALIAKNNELIALLREKRSSLISAAVTGRIDLRNEA